MAPQASEGKKGSKDCYAQRKQSWSRETQNQGNAESATLSPQGLEKVNGEWHLIAPNAQPAQCSGQAITTTGAGCGIWNEGRGNPGDNTKD